MKKQAIADGFARLRNGAVEQTTLIDGRRYQRMLHSPRHAFITKLVEADVSERMIQRVVDHARKGVTQGIYAKVIGPEKLRAYINKIAY
jgi:integrase